jgi:hypothetical protein
VKPPILVAIDGSRIGAKQFSYQQPFIDQCRWPSSHHERVARWVIAACDRRQFWAGCLFSPPANAIAAADPRTQDGKKSAKG